MNIALSNRSALSGVILLSFQYYCGVVLVILLFIYHFYHFIYVLHTFYIWYITSGIRALSLEEIVGKFFFRAETYSNVFKPQRFIITRINPRLRDSYTKEIHVVLKNTYVSYPCNPCWYPFEWQRIRQQLYTDCARSLEALHR